VATRLFIGNLPHEVTDSLLEGLFSEFGTVQSVEVMRDRDTGRSKGFGFVEMGSDAEAQAAIQGMQDREVEGRRLTVDAAKPRKYRSGGSFGNSFGDGGGYGGGRGYRGGGGGGRGRY
jgi:RNA recognition motif-containing protein